MMDKIFIRIGEAAEMVGVSTQTLRNWESLGILLPEIVRDTGHRYYTVKQIEDFIDSMVNRKDAV